MLKASESSDGAAGKHTDNLLLVTVPNWLCHISTQQGANYLVSQNLITTVTYSLRWVEPLTRNLFCPHPLKPFIYWSGMNAVSILLVICCCPLLFHYCKTIVTRQEKAKAKKGQKENAKAKTFLSLFFFCCCCLLEQQQWTIKTQGPFIYFFIYFCYLFYLLNTLFLILACMGFHSSQSALTLFSFGDPWWNTMSIYCYTHWNIQRVITQKGWSLQVTATKFLYIFFPPLPKCTFYLSRTLIICIYRKV